MRNRFGTKDRIGGFGTDGGMDVAEIAASTDQLSIVWNGANSAVAVSPKYDGVRGTYELDVARYPADFDLSAAVNLRRRNQLGLPLISDNTRISSVVRDFSERTRILALDGERLSYQDYELYEWLVSAERQMTLGTDDHPLFETSLEDTACMIRRLPNGQVAMTEVPRAHVKSLCEKMQALSGTISRSNANLVIETPVSSVARYFLSATREGNSVRRPGKESEVTVFLLVNRAGFSFGLWSPANGLFNEYSFLAPKDLGSAAGGAKIRGRQDAAPVKVKQDNGADVANQLDLYLRHAFDQLFLQLTPEKLEQLQMSNYAQIVWASDADLSDSVAEIVAEYEPTSGLEFVRISIPVDEAAAGGLMFGSFGFGGNVPPGAEALPPINLARDLLVLADTEDVERRRMTESDAQRRRSAAVFNMLAAPVIVLAIILAVIANLVRAEIANAIRESNADARTLELKPAVDRRRSYETNLKWYQEFISQVSVLRRQQPVGIGLLYQLDANYPFGIDSTFYVSEMKLNQSGDMEMKGLARNKDALTSFLKALEFAGGTESGSRLFNNLTYEVQESSQPAGAGSARAGLPTLTGSSLTANTAATPGTFAWIIKGNYSPMDEFAPPDPKAKTAAIQPAPAK